MTLEKELIVIDHFTEFTETYFEDKRLLLTANI